MTIVFSEKVSGFDLADLNLDKALDGAANLLTGGETLSTADDITYTLSGLAGLTADDATYVLSLAAATSGVTDMSGNALAINGHDLWMKKDLTAPTVDVVDVTPDPRSTSVDSIEIVFSEEVTGFDLGDLILDKTLDAAGNLLTGAETLTTADDVTFTLGGLSGITTADGMYTLWVMAAGSGIADLAGNALASDASDQWDKFSIVVVT